MFQLAGFKLITHRQLSRWRNIAHPVTRNFFVLEAVSSEFPVTRQLRPEPIARPVQEEIRVNT
jgi:hypothetical protein